MDRHDAALLDTCINSIIEYGPSEPCTKAAKFQLIFIIKQVVCYTHLSIFATPEYIQNPENHNKGDIWALCFSSKVYYHITPFWLIVLLRRRWSVHSNNLRRRFNYFNIDEVSVISKFFLLTVKLLIRINCSIDVCLAVYYKAAASDTNRYSQGIHDTHRENVFNFQPVVGWWQ